MKRLGQILVIILVLVLIGCEKNQHATSYSNFREWMHLAGPVQSFSEITYHNPTSSELSEDSISQVLGLLFDEFGNIFELQGKEEKLSFHYLDQQLLKIQRRRRVDNRPKTAILYQYNAEGDILERLLERGSGTGSLTVRESDRNEIMPLHERTWFEINRDFADYLFRTRPFEEDNQVSYEWDEQGNWVQEKFTDRVSGKVTQIKVRNIEYLTSDAKERMLPVLQSIQVHLGGQEVGLYRDYFEDRNTAKSALMIHVVGATHPDFGDYFKALPTAKSQVAKGFSVYPKPDLFDTYGMTVFRGESPNQPQKGYASMTFLFEREDIN